MKISQLVSQLITKRITFLIVLIVIGFFLHLYNLNWGAPYYFHPDERNIASSISQLSFPDRLHPNFFAYGSFPIYTVYATGVLSHLVTECANEVSTCIQGQLPMTNQVLFEEAIIIGRLYSALLGTLLIPLVFYLGKKLQGQNTGLLAAFFTTFSVGIIQFSHFATFEIWTTFFVTLLLLVCFRYLKTQSKKVFVLMACITGALFSIKISNAVLIIIPALSILFASFKNIPSLTKWFTSKQGFLHTSIFSLFLIIFSLSIFVLTNPFVLIDTEAFKGSITYESEVALGTLHVFYTGEFYNSIPIVFQFTKVFPFLLNPVVLLICLISLVVVTFQAVVTKNKEHVLLLVTFFVLFFTSSFMYVKWVRYMVPTLPFLYLICSIFLTKKILNSSRTERVLTRSILSIVAVVCIIFSLSYLFTSFIEEDTRLKARNTVSLLIPQDAQILSEVYDLGITPFNDRFHNITLFNFYDLDTQDDTFSDQLPILINENEYLILPSQRVLATRSLHKEQFPKGYAFYNELLTNKQKYTKIYETDCSIFCKITYLGDPISRFEGTANVFDRPHIIIFKINK